MSNNNIQIPATSQNPAQACEFELILDHSTIEHTEVFDTSTGHGVIVTTTHGTAFSRIDIEVLSEDANYYPLRVIFRDFNHVDTCEEYLANYMNSPALANVCEQFDELCTPFDADEE